MVLALIRFILGYVTVTVKGNGERFLELMNAASIKYHHLSSDSIGILTFSLGCKSFVKLMPIRRKTHSRIHIIKKSGLRFFLRKYKHRYGLFIGSALFSALLLILSMFVWRVEITGCESTTVDGVEHILSQSGFRVGAFKKSVDEQKLENDFLSKSEDYSWISVNIKGTTAYIEVKEHTDPPERVDASKPCSIYASRDGVIASVTSFMGYSVVKRGDTVTAGDLVVSGNYTDKYGVEYELHSYAKVMAYTERSYTVTVPLKKVSHIPTGNVKNKYTLKLIRFNIPLYFNKKISYNNYDLSKKEKQLAVRNDFVLPVTLVKNTFIEYVPVETVMSVDIAVRDAKEQLFDKEYDLTGVTVLGRSYDITETEDFVTVKVTLECYEDIGESGELEQRQE